jgi:GH35 family endo-1,4-beta-xylanase
VRSLRDKGCKVDVVGSQSHLELGVNTGERIAETISEFAAIGVGTALTEPDVDVIPRARHRSPKTRPEDENPDPYAGGCPPGILKKQAAVHGDAMRAVMEHRKHVDRVIFRGVNDRNSWLNTWPWKPVNHGLPFDREARPGGLAPRRFITVPSRIRCRNRRRDSLRAWSRRESWKRPEASSSGGVTAAGPPIGRKPGHG